MQDSLEDYLRMSKNSRQDVSDKISKEIVVTTQLKKEFDVRAMKIVEFCIEGKLRPEVFRRCLPFINQSHYQDIVEERAIAKLCGYSVCGKRVPEMPKKQYFISTKSNKVYDITERKNFCSNFCYKASLHIQKQIDNTPLWLRQLEDIPEYTFLQSSEGGLPGEHIDQGIIKQTQDMSFTSINSFAGASLGDILDVNPGKSKNNKTKGFKKSSMLKSTMQTIKENEIEEEIQVSHGESCKMTIKKNEEKRTHKACKKDSHHKMSCVVSLPSIEENEEKVSERLQNVKENESSPKIGIKGNIQKSKQDMKNDRSEQLKIELREVQEQLPIKSESMKKESIQSNESLQTRIPELSVKTEPPEKTIDSAEKNVTNKFKKQSKEKPTTSKLKVLDIKGIIRKALDEWLTLETCIFLYGEQKVKQILSEKKLSDYFVELKVAELQEDQQLKYMEICRRLQLKEMAEDKFDCVLTGGQKLKPLPDYRKLKVDTKDMTLKVKSFYEGSMYEQTDKNFPSLINKPDNDGGSPEEGSSAVLPPVDVNSQNLMRRKIFMNSLNKAIQQLLQSLGVSYFSSVVSDMQGLVRTFSLKADNITLKPIVWSYVALVLLHLLSIKDASLKEMLEARRSQEYINLLFETLPNKKNFVDDVLSHIRNIETFVEYYITRKDGNLV